MQNTTLLPRYWVHVFTRCWFSFVPPAVLSHFKEQKPYPSVWISLLPLRSLTITKEDVTHTPSQNSQSTKFLLKLCTETATFSCTSTLCSDPTRRSKAARKEGSQARPLSAGGELTATSLLPAAAIPASLPKAEKQDLLMCP